MNKSRHTVVVVVLTIAIILVTGVLLHILFGMELSKLTLEMLATLIAVVMVVASVAVTLFFQSEYEVDREFKTELFKRRIDVYYKLLLAYSEKKADGEIDAEEKADMLNLARSVALVASANTVVTLSNYLNGVLATGNLYFTDDEALSHALEKDKTYQGTFRNLVSCMRKDLRVMDEKAGKDAINRETELVKSAVENIVRPREQ